MWGGVAALALLAVTAIYSEVWGVWYVQDPFGPSNFFSLDRSSVKLTYFPNPPGGLFTGIPLYSKGWSTRHAMIRVFVAREWWPDVRVSQITGSGFASVQVPLWLPGVVCGLVAWWGWRVRPRHGPGHCQECGYDLRGAATSVCPECGCGSVPQAVRAASR